MQHLFEKSKQNYCVVYLLPDSEIQDYMASITKMFRMETVLIATENGFKKCVKEAVKEYFHGHCPHVAEDQDNYA